MNKEGKFTGGTKPCMSYLATELCRSSRARHPAGGLTVQGKDMESSFLAEQVSTQISPRQRGLVLKLMNQPPDLTGRRY